MTFSLLTMTWLAAMAMPLSAQTSNPNGTTFLHCVETNNSTPIDVTVDFARNTANNLPATINATAIDWTRHSDGLAGGAVNIVQTFHVDRTTGTLTLTSTVYSSGGQPLPGDNNPNASNYQCNVASAPVTKF